VIEASGWVARVCAAMLGIILTYSWLTFVLQQFPIARPWGEVLGAFLVRTLAQLGWGLLTSLPGLFTVAVIFLVTRFAVRMAGSLFDALEQGRVEIKGLTGAKAVPTRRITTTLLWLFAIVVAYPYLPGSGTDAFKGVSVFVGLVVSLCSSGIVNQLMSGFMLIYSGALSPGDVVRVGDVEGKVTSLGVFTTRLKDFQNQEINIPNNVVISGTAVNWTRYAPEGVMFGTSVTIGYDTPWRQVEAMLLKAAERTAGLSPTCPPYVLQTSLSDFYVEYTLYVCVEDPMRRIPTFAALHANIQDAFNEYGVQIMSPHYWGDPAGAKVVPADKWFVPPARPTGEGV
jgi:small-conductance mechanosensitive channel